MEELLHANNHKEKMNTHEYHIQELWDTNKRQNLRIHRVEEETEIQTKDKGNLVNETIAEISQNLCNNIDIHVQETF
jgi:hypothetical protein